MRNPHLSMGALALVLALLAGAVLVEASSFWHITDTHVDWLYKPQSEPVDEYCRNGNGTSGLFGDYFCYGPQSVLESEIQWMS